MKELSIFIDTAFLGNDEINLVLEKTVDGDDEKGWVPPYHFAICNHDGIKMGVCYCLNWQRCIS